MANDAVQPFPWAAHLDPHPGGQCSDCDLPGRSGVNGSLRRLMANLAARLATIEPSRIDDAIADGLRELGETLQVDSAVLWSEPAEPGQVVASYHWSRHSQAAPPPLQLPSARSAAWVESADAIWFSGIDEVANAADRDLLEKHGVRSAAWFRMAALDAALGRRGLAVSTTTRERHWSPSVIEYLRLAAAVFSQALMRHETLTALKETSEELERLRQNAKRNSVQTRHSVAALRLSRPIVSESPSVRRALAQVEQVASTPSTVLLLGETGVGKELFAQAIHELSARHKREMIRVSCAAIPSSLIESELFGHERGAFTGAFTRQIGRFEFANHSTLFLDEIGELSPEVQVKLLRVLEQRVIERVGSTHAIDIDVRIIAATHRNLDKAVAEGKFREDLFYRLNVFPIAVPPLRERAEDIPGLVWQFVEEFSKKLAKPIETLSHHSMERLQRYAWPGNVRELRNVIERAVIVADSPRLTVSLPDTGGAGPRLQVLTLDEIQIEHIRATLQSTAWRVRGPGGAAERLGVKPTTLESRMAKYRLTRQQT